MTTSRCVRSGGKGSLFWGLGVFVILSSTAAWAAAKADEPAATIIEVGNRGLPEVIAAALPHSVILCNPNHELTLSTPILIDKPLTLRGMHAKLPERLGNTSLVIVRATGVRFTDFELHGNANSVSQDDRAPLLRVHAGDFAVERGVFADSSKDGVMIEAEDQDIVGGVVRDVVGMGVIRDTVSISGGSQGARIRNVLVDNVRAYRSSRRGAVEVSDGTDNVTVRKVFAEECVYAVDVQDHNRPHQDNRNVVVQDIYAVRCQHALRTSNTPKGHINLTVRDVTAERCRVPVQVSHTDNVVLDTIRVIDHDAADTPMTITNCNSLSIRNVTILNSTCKRPALLVQDCNQTTIDGVILRGTTKDLASAVTCLATAGRPLVGLCVRNVVAPNLPRAGIVLAADRKGGTLTEFIISENLARIVNTVSATNGIIRNNLPEPQGSP
jgi:hypothetical protein